MVLISSLVIPQHSTDKEPEAFNGITDQDLTVVGIGNDVFRPDLFYEFSDDAGINDGPA